MSDGRLPTLKHFLVYNPTFDKVRINPCVFYSVLPRNVCTYNVLANANEYIFISFFSFFPLFFSQFGYSNGRAVPTSNCSRKAQSMRSYCTFTLFINVRTSYGDSGRRRVVVSSPSLHLDVMLCTARLYPASKLHMYRMYHDRVPRYTC